MKDYSDQVKAAMTAAGVTPPEGRLIFDGQIHRYEVTGDKPRSRNGWYVLHNDGIPSGSFGNWKTGVFSNWCSRSLNSMSFAERAEQQKRITDARDERQKITAQAQQEAARDAQYILDIASPAHPKQRYLVNKQIAPYIARQRGNTLVIPIINIAGDVCSLQFIHPDGSKVLLSGGAKKGNFMLVHGLISNSVIRIAEGFATACTLARSYPDSCVVAAIDLGNLQPVATIIRHHRPEAKIIICADDDREQEGNPGATKGRAAAIAVNALFVLPDWPENAPMDLTDFNDLGCWLANKKRVSV